MRTRYAAGYAASAGAAAELQIVAGPIEAQADPGSIPGVLFAGGLGSTPGDTFAYTLQGYARFPWYIARHYPLMCGEWGGAATWGNDLAISRLVLGRTWLQGGGPFMTAKAGKVAVAGGSMGFADVCNYAYAHQADVGCIIGGAPAVNIDSLHTRNPSGAAAGIDAAYSTWDVGTDGVAHDPSVYGEDLDVPVLLFASPDDDTVPYSEVQDFADMVPECTVVDASGEHGAVQWPDDFEARIVSFINEHLG